MSQYLQKPALLKPIIENYWLPDQFITVQWDSTDPSRTMSPVLQEKIHSKYQGAVIHIGGNGKGVFKDSLAHMGHAIYYADFHVGSDSGMFHLATLYKQPDKIHLYSKVGGYKSHHLVRAVNNGSKHFMV